MYRLLEVGEVIEKGDEYYSLADKWESFPPSCVGMKTVPHDAPMRRLVKPAVTPAVGPDPGEGWRLLKLGEMIQRGDEFHSICGDWCEVEHSVGMTMQEAAERWGSLKDKPFRRRVTQPAPVVSVGDRVKVLSGPWAGCTGVVVEDWGKPKPDGEFEVLSYSVRFDFVFVGGPQLETIIWGKDLEPLPPVVPEVPYRDLSHGETIRIEDEYLFGGCWLAGSTDTRSVGKKLERYHVRHRRPVRLQSPGWRYLDAGETVQAGDEAGFHCAPIWRPALEHFSEGYVVRGLGKEDSETFRRKLPANVGG